MLIKFNIYLYTLNLLILHTSIYVLSKSCKFVFISQYPVGTEASDDLVMEGSEGPTAMVLVPSGSIIFHFQLDRIS